MRNGREEMAMAVDRSLLLDGLMGAWVERGSPMCMALTGLTVCLIVGFLSWRVKSKETSSAAMAAARWVDVEMSE